MARIALEFKELRDLLMGKEINHQGTQVILNDIGWQSMLTAFTEALSFAGVQAAIEGRADWQVGDRLASVDRSVPIVTRISPEAGAAIQLEARRIVEVFLHSMMSQGVPSPQPGVNMMPMQLPDMLTLIWIHGFGNGHDYVREFGALSELNLSLADMAEADLLKEKKDGDDTRNHDPG